MADIVQKGAINGPGIIAKRCNGAHATASNASANGFAPFGGKINAIVFLGMLFAQPLEQFLFYGPSRRLTPFH